MRQRVLDKIKDAKICDIEVASNPGIPGHKVNKIKLDNGITLKFTVDGSEPVVVVWGEKGNVIR
jgi:hypothetical protein